MRYGGYKTATPVAIVVGDGQPTALAPVLLVADRKLLGGVTVTAAKPFIEQHADKLMLNVAASPIAAGGMAYDVLGRAPGVLEQNGSFMLRGKRVTVLLDGKTTNLSGEELKTMLSAMSSSIPDKVEVIVNPLARYDANGAARINNVPNVGLGTARPSAYLSGNYTLTLPLGLKAKCRPCICHR